MKIVRVAVSGGFDPLTPGHVEYLRMASELGGYLIVILNTDEFLISKKGYAFMPFEDRKTILESVKYVDEVIRCVDEDMTVAESIRQIKPNIFAKGGDRNKGNLPKSELDACDSVGCSIVCGLGEKTHSSSWYIKKGGTDGQGDKCGRATGMVSKKGHTDKKEDGGWSIGIRSEIFSKTSD